MQDVQQVEDIRKESLIRKRWGFTQSKPSTYPDDILITGANSFVGVHVVNKLQNEWQGYIHLLLRAGSRNEAINKMRNAFTTWHLGKFDDQKFIIHLGDVSQNMMGLKASEYSALKRDIGFVLHLAMNPLYHLPYAHFKRLWLPELSRMISFCGDKKYPKSLHYPSSYNANFFTTDDDFQHLNTNAWQSGYAGFKWVTNKVMENAFSQNLAGCLYDIPLVVGSEEKGVCPSHYSIWHILDMFLKTGYYIDFEFKIIPIDILSEIIVSNLLADKQDNGELFLRPVLDESVNHIQFSNTVANILGLKHTEPEILRETCHSKRRYDFMFPADFYKMIEKVNNLPSVLPENYSKQNLPSTPMVFLSNLNRILSQRQELNEIANYKF